ncbi:hypothetical protein ACWIGW_10755 [Nocardia brasiliensis]
MAKTARERMTFAVRADGLDLRVNVASTAGGRPVGGRPRWWATRWWATRWWATRWWATRWWATRWWAHPS